MTTVESKGFWRQPLSVHLLIESPIFLVALGFVVFDLARTGLDYGWRYDHYHGRGAYYPATFTNDIDRVLGFDSLLCVAFLARFAFSVWYFVSGAMLARRRAWQECQTPKRMRFICLQLAFSSFLIFIFGIVSSFSGGLGLFGVVAWSLSVSTSLIACMLATIQWKGTELGDAHDILPYTRLQDETVEFKAA